MLVLAAILTLAPWKGALPAAASVDARAYKLTVRGQANQDVRLAAAGLPRGWIASFCTGTICSPMRYTMHLDSAGNGEVEFEAIRIDDSAPKRAHVTVSAGDGRVETDVKAR